MVEIGDYKSWSTPLGVIQMQIHYFQWRHTANTLKTESNAVVTRIRCNIAVFSGAPAPHRDGKISTFFDYSKCAAGHVARINLSAPQDLLLVVRSAELKMEEQLIILVWGTRSFTTCQVLTILTPTEGKTL